MTDIKVGETRIIPKGAIVWSVANHSNIRLVEDAIIEITHIIDRTWDGIGVQPKELIISNVNGYNPILINRGRDEWLLGYSETEPYKIPEPVIPSPVK